MVGFEAKEGGKRGRKSMRGKDERKGRERREREGILYKHGTARQGR